MSAKYYIYRNLHAGEAFSVRHRGRVVNRLEHFIAQNVQFKVNEAGRLRTLTERHKNVHAFVVAELYVPSKIDALGLTRVSYNPFRASTFTVNGVPIMEAKAVLFTQGQCFLLE